MNCAHLVRLPSSHLGAAKQLPDQLFDGFYHTYYDVDGFDDDLVVCFEKVYKQFTFAR